jgi:hypothetical protein
MKQAASFGNIYLVPELRGEFIVPDHSCRVSESHHTCASQGMCVNCVVPPYPDLGPDTCALNRVDGKFPAIPSLKIKAPSEKRCEHILQSDRSDLFLLDAFP